MYGIRRAWASRVDACRDTAWRTTSESSQYQNTGESNGQHQRVRMTASESSQYQSDFPIFRIIFEYTFFPVGLVTPSLVANCFLCEKWHHQTQKIPWLGTNAMVHEGIRFMAIAFSMIKLHPFAEILVPFAEIVVHLRTMFATLFLELLSNTLVPRTCAQVRRTFQELTRFIVLSTKVLRTCAAFNLFEIVIGMP